MTRWPAGARAGIAFAALGAGLVHLGLAVGAVPGVAATLALVGALEVLWGALAVGRGHLPIPRVALAVALVPAVAWGAAVLLGIPGPRVLPMLAATALDLVVAAGIAAGIRRGPRVESRRPLLAVALAALVVGVVTVPALALTEAVERLPAAPAHEVGGH